MTSTIIGKLTTSVLTVLFISLSTSCISIDNTASRNILPRNTTPSNTPPTSRVPAVSDFEELASELKIKEPNLELKKATEIPKLSEQEAIERAKEIVGTGFGSEHATSIKAIYALFTDNITLKFPEGNTLIKDLPVWIVTFDGLEIRGHGPGTQPSDNKPAPDPHPFNTQLHIIIDANTGKDLRMFSYK